MTETTKWWVPGGDYAMVATTGSRLARDTMKKQMMERHKNIPKGQYFGKHN